MPRDSRMEGIQQRVKTAVDSMIDDIDLKFVFFNLTFFLLVFPTVTIFPFFFWSKRRRSEIEGVNQALSTIFIFFVSVLSKFLLNFLRKHRCSIETALIRSDWFLAKFDLTVRMQGSVMCMFVLFLNLYHSLASWLFFFSVSINI